MIIKIVKIYLGLSLVLCGQGGCTCSERGQAHMAETLRAHASVICLQRPSLPTVRLNK